MEDNLLMLVVGLLMRRSVLLDLVYSNKEGQIGDVKVESSLGCSDLERVELKVLCGRSKAANKIATLDFRRDSHHLFKDLPRGISHGLENWKIRRLKRVGQHLSTASSKHKIGESLRVKK